MRREFLPAQVEKLLAGAEPLPDGARLVAALVDADALYTYIYSSKLIERPGIVACSARAMAGGRTLPLDARRMCARTWAR